MKVRDITEARSTKLLNECYGTSKNATLRKIGEEYTELVDAAANGDLQHEKDEASDVLAVLVRYCNNQGWTVQELLEMAIDKATKRKTNPNYKR